MRRINGAFSPVPALLGWQPLAVSDCLLVMTDKQQSILFHWDVLNIYIHSVERAGDIPIQTELLWCTWPGTQLPGQQSS